MREIGVGYDASPESEHALGVARKLAAEKHTKLSAFEVVALPSYVYLGAPGLLAAESIRHPLDSARQRLGALDGVEPISPTASRPRSWRSTAPRSTCW